MFIDTSSKFRVFTRTIISSCIALILILSGFQALAFSSFGDTLISLIQQQGSISQRIAKNALILQYVPSGRVNALNELQNVLPNFETTQKLVPRLPAATQTILNETNPDYQDIDTAAHKLINNPNAPTDPLQVQIILQHERTYYLSVSQAVAALKTSIAADKTSLLVIALIIDVLLLIIGISFWIVVERLIKQYEEIELKKKESEHAHDANQQSL
jgi:hypothetical protein